MKFGLNEAVAKYIVYAQMASDAGKGIYDLQDELFWDIPAKGYSLCKNEYQDKDLYTYKAISIITKSKSHPTGFTFYVTSGGITPYLVYFTFKLHGKRYQISFHSFDTRLERYKDTNSNLKIRWDEKSSRDNCVYLYAQLFL